MSSARDPHHDAASPPEAAQLQVALRLLAERHTAAQRLERLEVAADRWAEDRQQLARRLDALRGRRVVRLAEAFGAWRRGETSLGGLLRRLTRVLRGRDEVVPTRLRLEDPIVADPFDAPTEALEHGRLLEAEVWLRALEHRHGDDPVHARLSAMVASARRTGEPRPR